MVGDRQGHTLRDSMRRGRRFEQYLDGDPGDAKQDMDPGQQADSKAPQDERRGRQEILIPHTQDYERSSKERGI